MKFNTLFITGLVSITLLFGCKNSNESKVLTKEVTFTKEGELQLKKAENDSLLATLEIEFAETAYETETGLMYRKSMQDNRGMLFIFEDEVFLEKIIDHARY